MDRRTFLGGLGRFIQDANQRDFRTIMQSFESR